MMLNDRILNTPFNKYFAISEQSFSKIASLPKILEILVKVWVEISQSDGYRQNNHNRRLTRFCSSSTIGASDWRTWTLDVYLQVLFSPFCIVRTQNPCHGGATIKSKAQHLCIYPSLQWVWSNILSILIVVKKKYSPSRKDMMGNTGTNFLLASW